MELTVFALARPRAGGRAHPYASNMSAPSPTVPRLSSLPSPKLITRRNRRGRGVSVARWYEGVPG